MDATTFRWATVTRVVPLRVRLDGDTTELPITPEDFSGELLYVGMRVWVQFYGRRIFVLGKGPATPRNVVPLGDFENADVGSLRTVASTAYETYPDEWVQVLHPTNDNGTAAVSETEAHSGSRSLKITNAASYMTWPRSPIFDVTPGDRLMLSYWYLNTGGFVASDHFLRVAGGSDGGLTEYEGGSQATSIPLLPHIENNELDDDAFGWQPLGTIFVVPAGVYKAALRPLEYLPPGATEYYLDDFRVERIGGAGDVGLFPGDSGWITPPLVNSWESYGAGYDRFGVRRIDGVAHMRGLVRYGSSGTSTLTTIPEGLRPLGSNLFPAIINGTPYTICRLDLSGSTGVLAFTGANTGFTSVSGISWVVQR